MKSFSAVVIDEEIVKLEAEITTQRDKYHELHVKQFEIADDLSLARRSIKRLETELATANAKIDSVFATANQGLKKRAEEAKKIAMEYIQSNRVPSGHDHGLAGPREGEDGPTYVAIHVLHI